MSTRVRARQDVPGAPLTARELQVLKFVARGWTNERIGAVLGIETLTAKTHMGRIMRKLSARNRAHAVAIGIRTGLIGLDSLGVTAMGCAA